jgi:hypothetical protein
MEKEGLQTAIDFTKLLMALAGGGIALVVQPSFFAGSCWIKILSFGALIFLSICVITGLVMFSGGAVMLGHADYNLERATSGLLNVFSFGFGFLFLAAAIAIKLLAT